MLDQQLQNTIYQFEHKQGVVQKIDENTQQLAKALSEGVPIVISTIQKFPFIAQALDTLAKKGEAVDLRPPASALPSSWTRRTARRAAKRRWNCADPEQGGNRGGDRRAAARHRGRVAIRGGQTGIAARRC